jgi:hypothetical protein
MRQNSPVIVVEDVSPGHKNHKQIDFNRLDHNQGYETLKDQIGLN